MRFNTVPCDLLVTGRIVLVVSTTSSALSLHLVPLAFVEVLAKGLKRRMLLFGGNGGRLVVRVMNHFRPFPMSFVTFCFMSLANPSGRERYRSGSRLSYMTSCAQVMASPGEGAAPSSNPEATIRIEVLSM